MKGQYYWWSTRPIFIQWIFKEPLRTICWKWKIKHVWYDKMRRWYMFISKDWENLTYTSHKNLCSNPKRPDDRCKSVMRLLTEDIVPSEKRCLPRLDRTQKIHDIFLIQTPHPVLIPIISLTHAHTLSHCSCDILCVCVCPAVHQCFFCFELFLLCWCDHPERVWPPVRLRYSSECACRFMVRACTSQSDDLAMIYILNRVLPWLGYFHEVLHK